MKILKKFIIFGKKITRVYYLNNYEKGDGTKDSARILHRWIIFKFHWNYHRLNMPMLICWQNLTKVRKNTILKKKLDLGDLVKDTSLSDRAFFNQMKKEVQSLFVTEDREHILNIVRHFHENAIKQGADGYNGFFIEKSFAYDKINIKF